jgi:hypothetical protein
MTNSEKPKVEKKTYTKPTVTMIPLVAEEAVLGFCKLVRGVQTTCEDPNCIDIAGS